MENKNYHSSTTNRELKQNCLNRVPEVDSKYFLLTECVDGEISIYSKGVSWGADGEVRAPRAVNGLDFIEFYKEKGVQCFVIHTIEEFECWVRNWEGPALIKPSVWAWQK